MRFFLEWNTKHRKNVAFSPNNRQTEPRQKWLSDLKAFSLCLCLIVVLLTSPSLLSFCLTVRFVGSLLVECCWSTKIGPRGVLRNCQGTTEKPAALWRRVSGPQERMGETTCTSQSLCLISPVPPIGFVQLPWSFYGPFGRSRPTQSPEGGEKNKKQNHLMSHWWTASCSWIQSESKGSYLFLPVRLYPVGSPRIAVLAGRAGQVFFVQSWFSFWLRMLHYSAGRPWHRELGAETKQ